MATEEIDLNEALEHAGVTPVETDLGEYIIQLAHEKPSHIIAPAIHKTKGQVAELFSRELKGNFEADPEILTAVARKALREKFLQADMGITGANFAVAETGTIVLVTNEGNGRLTTTCPRVHVAIMGIEKVIPRFIDLPVFLKLLARGATGQTLYTAAMLGVGNITGMLATGFLYDATKTVATAYVAAGVVEFLPLILTLTQGRKLEPQEPNEAAASGV